MRFHKLFHSYESVRAGQNSFLASYCSNASAKEKVLCQDLPKQDGTDLFFCLGKEKVLYFFTQ